MGPSTRIPTPTLLSLVAILLCTTLCVAHSTRRNPLVRLARVHDATIQTSNFRIHALSTFDLNFDAYDTRIRLKLEPNHHVIAPGATYSYLGPSGQVERVEPIERLEHKVFKGTVLLRDEGRQNSWTTVGSARIYVKRDGVAPLFDGKFDIYGDHYHVKTTSSYMRTRHEGDPMPDWTPLEEEYVVVYRDSDIAAFPASAHSELKRDGGQQQQQQHLACQGDLLEFNSRPEHPVLMGFMTKRDESSVWTTPASGLLSKRQLDGIPGSGGNSAGVNLVSTIGNTKGCPTTRKVALVGVATDCTYTATFNSTEAARQNVVAQMNSASDLYEKTFNITLGLQNLTVTSAECPGTPQSATPWNVPCSSSVDLQARLNLFSAWRGNQQDTNSHWTLLTDCNSGSAVGLAWLGMACISSSQTSNSSTGGGQETVSGANVVAKTGEEWQVIAHETGHTFGAVHDCIPSTCSDGAVTAQQCCPLSSSMCDAGERYIMNPSTAQGITSFSPCSIGNICAAMERNSVNTQCFSANKDVTTISGQQCGNGIVEAGEDCDCGGTAGCGTNACCNPTTCRFNAGAVCDDSNDDCCRSCQLAASGTVCRASTGVCDPQETCTGSGATCPSDKTKPDGSGCGDGLKCASGQCTSRDQQCKTVMGSYTSGNDTYACDSIMCSLSCASPEFGTGICYGLQQNFLDGTDCGGGGTCQNGVCKGATVSGEISSWIDDHKFLVIGLGAGLGALLLFAFVSCLWRSFRRGRQQKRFASMRPPPPPPQQQQPWGAGPVPPPAGGFYGARSAQRPRGASRSRSRSASTASMLIPHVEPPRGPPPPQQQMRQGGWDEGTVPVPVPAPPMYGRRTGSVRYA